MKWNPFSDWLPLDNAIALVKYWEIDLKYAEDWIKVMDGMENNHPGFMKQYKLAVQDVKHSKKELAKAKVKLAESEKLEKQGK